MEITALGLLAIKAETTYLTDPVPTMALNAIPTVGDSLSWNVQSTAVDRKLLDGTLDSIVGFNTMPNVVLKFRYELRGNRRDGANQLDISNGNSTQKLEIDALLQAANLDPVYTAAGTPGVEGVSAGTRNVYVTYKPKVYTTQGPSVTCYWYTVLKLHKLIGGKVNIDKITWEAGKMVYVEFSVSGKYVAPVDLPFDASSAVFLATKPPQFDAATVAIGSYNAAVLNSLSVELGNQVQMRKSAIDTDSIAGFVISGFQPKGSFDPESVTEATHPLWADWKASSTKTIAVTTGTQTGNKFTGTFVGEYKSVNYADRDGTRIHQVSFNIVKEDLTGAAGSQFQLKFF